MRVVLAMLLLLGLAACGQRDGARGPYVGAGGGVNILR